MSVFSRIAKSIARAVALVAPAAATRYLRQQQVFERAYDPGKTGGPDRYWDPINQTGDQAIAADWQKSTNKSRDLLRNNPLAANAMRNKAALVVGDALWPQARVRTPDGKLNKAVNRLIEADWERWAETCMANGRDWDELKKLAYRHLEGDGEIIVHEVSTDLDAYQLELLEPDQIDATVDGTLKNGNRAVRGIEFNSFGRPVAFWILDAHPGDTLFSTSSRRIDASQILHVFDPERVTEGRGICRYVASIEPTYSHAQHRQAVMDLLRIAASYGVFIRTDYPDDMVEQDMIDNDSVVLDANGKPVKHIHPAGLHYLGTKQSIESAKPEQPTATFREFEQSHLRMAAAGFGMSYETFTGDMSNVNFSSLRGGQGNERTQYRLQSGLMVRRLCRPVYRHRMDIRVALGILRLPGYWADRDNFQAATWSLPGFPTVDPLKDEEADAKALANLTETHRRICERKGLDWDDVVEQRRAEREDIEEAGLTEADAAAAISSAELDARDEREEGKRP
jgi:lambda family phage portal protein